MANVNSIFKRYNGSTWDNIYFKTIPSNIIGLLESGKIASTYIPDYLLGNSRCLGAYLDGTYTSNGIETIFTSKFGLTTPLRADVANNDKYKGSYIIMSSTMTITGFNVAYGVNADCKHVLDNFVDDDTEVGGSVELEVGDFLVYNGCTIVGSYIVNHWGVINNTYSDASTSKKGVVKLTDTIENANTDVPTSSAIYTHLTNTYVNKNEGIVGVSYDDVTNKLTLTKDNGSASNVTLKTWASVIHLHDSIGDETTHNEISINGGIPKYCVEGGSTYNIYHEGNISESSFAKSISKLCREIITSEPTENVVTGDVCIVSV